MRMIKPYGRSVVKDDGKRKVVLRNGKDLEGRELPDFAESEPKLIIAQWISAIDKVIPKPRGRKKPSPKLYKLREELGKFCWEKIIAEHEFSEGDQERLKEIKERWDWKLHPYGKSGEKGEEPREGRWYKAFARKADSSDLDFASIAETIKQHLYEKQRRIGHVDKPRYSKEEKQKGLIKARAQSVEKSRPPLPEKEKSQNDKGFRGWREEHIGWSGQDEEKFFVGEIKGLARAIWDENEQLEKDKGRSILSHEAAEIISKHYKTCFWDSEKGKVLERVEIKSAKRPDGRRRDGELALWDAVRASYRALLSRGKKRKTTSQRDRSLQNVLPKNNRELIDLLRKKNQNRQINDLIRLGRVLHYENEASTGQAGFYRQSAGQDAIKRTEAFVRVWRNAISQAVPCVKSWIDPDGVSSRDILGGCSDLEKFFEKNFKAEEAEKHAPLIFGRRWKLLKDLETRDLAFSMAWLTMQCRHQVVHFTDRKDFVSKLKKHLSVETIENILVKLHHLYDEDLKDSTETIENILVKLHHLYDEDLKDSTEQLAKDVEAAGLQDFADQSQMKAFLSLVAGDADSDLVLPRFRRVLRRLANTKQLQSLPVHKNLGSLWAEWERLVQQGKDSPERLKLEITLAKYLGLKMLYEGPAFRQWLAKQEITQLNGWIDEARKRATKQAQSINDKGKKYGCLIEARAEQIGRLHEGEKITDLNRKLAAMTATEMRVQNGYESNGEQAREQAGWIDKFLCDVIGKAFHAFLEEKRDACNWLLNLDPKKSKRLQQEASVKSGIDWLKKEIDKLQKKKEKVQANWLKVLYALLSFVPRDDVARLLHQFRKWEILETKAKVQDDSDIKGLRHILALSVQMSEARFTGQYAKECEVTQNLSGLFKEASDFERVFPSGDDGKQRLATQRGLRQILRFGHLPILMPVFEKHPISSADVREMRTLEEEAAGENGRSKIAVAQDKRKELHKKLVRESRPNSCDPKYRGNRQKLKRDIEKYEEQRANYKEQLDTVVTRHRDLSAQVRLTNHLRLHRLMMRLWSRLLDYAGLWERDRYFVMRALMELEDKKSQEVWPATEGKSREDQERRRNDFIENAEVSFHKKAEDSQSNPVRYQFEHFFSCGSKGIRNRLAHFELCRKDERTVNLTACVNEVRELMSYDRKLKNAVSKSIIDIMDEEGFTLTWCMNERHQLSCPKIRSKTLRHFKKKGKDLEIEEPRHNDHLVDMVCCLFGLEKTPPQHKQHP